MTKDEAKLEYFKELREAGLTKLFEEDQRQFFAGIVSTAKNPMNKEKLNDIFSQEGPSKIPDVLKDYANKILNDEDIFRYHMISIRGEILVHYIYINNASLTGRDERFANPAGLSGMITSQQLVPPEEENPYDSEYKEFGIILIGDKNPVITDRTRGFVVKHEFAHIIHHYVCNIVSPGIRDKYLEWLTPEELQEFDEFICDFIQFDFTIINKYTTNPIARFVDTMPLIYNKDAIEKYNPMVKAISPYFNFLMGAAE